MTDPFDKIHALLREQNRKKALKLIYDETQDIVLPPYDNDANHAWYVVGDIMFKEEDYDGALVAFEKALTMREDDLDALIAVAECHSEVGNPDKAENTLRRALLLGKNNGRLLYNLANALFDQQKYEESIIVYKDALATEDVDISDRARKNLELAEKKAIKKRKC